MSSDTDDVSIWGYIQLGWIGSVFLSTTAAILYVRVNEIGPRAFWASDVCPDPHESCGVMPLVIPAAALGSMLLLFAGALVINFAEKTYLGGVRR